MSKSTLKQSAFLAIASLGVSAQAALAGAIGFEARNDNMLNDCVGVPSISCSVVAGAGIPNPVAQNPNAGELLVWEEKTLTLASALEIDQAAMPLHSSVIAHGLGFAVDAGTTITSYMIEWDRLNRAGRRVDTAIEFENEILGFITSRGNLLATDDLLGATGITYLDFNARGLENNDSIGIGADAFTANISLITTSPGDWIRVITTAEVPEPSSLALLGLGLVGFGISRKRFAR